MNHYLITNNNRTYQYCNDIYTKWNKAKTKQCLWFIIQVTNNNRTYQYCNGIYTKWNKAKTKQCLWFIIQVYLYGYKLIQLTRTNQYHWFTIQSDPSH